MWFLAIRHLFSRKRQTLLTLMGIILGTAAYVAISGMMLGFQSFIIDQLVNNDSHVRISAREDFITAHSMDKDFFGPSVLVSWAAPPSGRRDNAYILFPGAWTARLAKEPYVAAFAEQLVSQVIITRGKFKAAANLIGVEPTQQSQVTNIQKYMTVGNFKDIGTGGNRIVIGDLLLKKLGATVLETIYLSVGFGEMRPFKIVGTFHLGVKALDESNIFGALADVQLLGGTPGRISDIAVRLYKVELAADVASTWNMLGDEKVQSWDQAHEGIMSVFTTQDIVRNAMTLSILIVAGFGIYNILGMAVTQKRREIAILRSMGYLPRDITTLFLLQGLVLGIAGGFLGAILGFGVSHVMASIRVSAERGLGGEHMMISFLPSIYLKGFLLAFLASALSGFLPARAAGKLTPIDIIRSESG
ncbi:MAG: ABC transporter permease [Bdellovibrio sp.]|nr:ABC transporter permease [Bdellovibrio sp.]